MAMTQKITLEMVKHQCRIDHDDEDDLLMHYLNAALIHASNYIDGLLDESNLAVQQAVLLLVGHWYDNREAVNNDYQTPQSIPFGFEALLQPYLELRSATGAPKRTWSVIDTVWGQFTPVSAKDVIAGKAAGVEILARLKIRYRDDIKRNMCVVCRGKTYDIIGEPLADNGSGKEYLTLMLQGAGDESER